MLRLGFQRLFGGIGAAVLEIEDGAFKVGILGVVDFDDAFVGASYHELQVLSTVELRVKTVQKSVENVENSEKLDFYPESITSFDDFNGIGRIIVENPVESVENSDKYKK